MQILDLKERYPFVCPCEAEMSVGPCIFMQGFQINSGRIHCPSCKRALSIRIDEKNERMEFVSYDPMMKVVQLPESCFRNATPEEEEQITQDRVRRHVEATTK